MKEKSSTQKHKQCSSCREHKPHQAFKMGSGVCRTCSTKWAKKPKQTAEPLGAGSDGSWMSGGHEWLYW